MAERHLWSSNWENLAVGKIRDEHPLGKGFPHLGSRTYTLGFQPESQTSGALLCTGGQEQLSPQLNQHVHLAAPSRLNQQQCGQRHVLRVPSVPELFAGFRSQGRQKWNRAQAADSIGMTSFPLYPDASLQPKLKHCRFCEPFPNPPVEINHFLLCEGRMAQLIYFSLPGFGSFWLPLELFIWSLLLGYKLSESRDWIMTI